MPVRSRWPSLPAGQAGRRARCASRARPLQALLLAGDQAELALGLLRPFGQGPEILRGVVLPGVVTQLREHLKQRVDPLVEPPDVQLGKGKPGVLRPSPGPWRVVPP